VARTYVALGVEHILLGADHLLFVLGLLLLVAGARPLVATITAFTVAHSVTLAAVSLGFVRVPSAPVEAVIALSVMFVAAEVLRARAGRPGFAARAPWVVALAFGLLHGCGFAGALAEIGLPAGCSCCWWWALPVHCTAGRAARSVPNPSVAWSPTASAPSRPSGSSIGSPGSGPEEPQRGGRRSRAVRNSRPERRSPRRASNPNCQPAKDLP
jgi:hypothetical protein